MGDIRQLQQALEESEAHRQALLDLALDCVICADSQARITDFNAAAQRTFRISRSAALGKDLAETILPPIGRDYLRQDLFSPNASNEIEVIGNRFETRAIRSDGTEFPAELTVDRAVHDGTTSFIVYVRDITARKRAEEEMVRLAAIVESSQDAIISQDLDLKIISWNRGAEQMYGYIPNEVIGKEISMLAPEGRTHEILVIMDELRVGRRIENFEIVHKAKDGGLLDVSLTVSPVLNSSGSVIGFSAIARDVTARNLAEEALRKATETSIYASPVPIVATDTEGHITMWNPAAEKVFGWKEEEVLGRFKPIVPENDVTQQLLLDKRVLAGNTLTGVEVRRQKRDGSKLTISLSATPLWDSSQKVRGLVAFFTDISDRKRAEEALQKAEEKYRSIFENALEGIYQTTPDGKYISANPALARMLGFDSPDELISSRKDLQNQEYVNPDLRAEFVRLMEECGFVENFEYQAYRKDGKSIWVSENAHTVRNAEGDILYFEGTVHDITDRLELEQQMRQMQKIEAIGRLAGGVAHDFNNILMAISSFGELLSRKLPEGDASRRYLDEIVKATDRGSSLTQGLLAFSRKQVLSPKVVDLNALIAEQIDMLKRLIPENIELRFVPNAAIGKVRVDLGQVEQVVMNLVVNARDAMLNGGQLVIETDDVDLGQADRGSQDAPPAGTYTVLAVSDNGCGMDAETKAHLFEPFFTTKQPGKGTGLGLATVFGIVKQSSGHIFVHSKPGHGTTFKIYLPRVEGAVPLDHNDIRKLSIRGNETILLVEDEEAVRKSAAEYLTENGYTVLIAGRGDEALEIAERHEEPIHLMLTDVVMPKMSGRDLAEKIKVSHPETKVVFMSGYSNNLLSNQQILNPKHVLIQKPFRLAALGICIREALSKSAAASARK